MGRSCKGKSLIDNNFYNNNKYIRFNKMELGNQHVKTLG